MTAPVRIMVVDDTEHVRRMLRHMLELDGFQVVAEAGSAAGALAQVADADPDVVVIDYMMPDVDGLEAAHQVRALRPDQVIILYSAFIDREVQRRADEIGIDVCVNKLEGLESLEREIARVSEALT